MTSKKPEDSDIYKAQRTPAIKQFLKDAVEFGKLPRADLARKLKHLEKSVWFMGEGTLGDILGKYLGWSLPCKEAVDLIKNQKVDGPVYDVLAGTGYWTAALNAAGVKTHASDISISTKTNEFNLKPRYSSVSKKNAVALAAKWANKGKPVNVLMSWIPGSMPVSAMDLPKGSILFVVGDQPRFLSGMHDFFLNTSMPVKRRGETEDERWERDYEKRYTFLKQVDLVDTNALANAYGERAIGDSTITAYIKGTDSMLKTEALVRSILLGKTARDVIESAVK